MDCNIVVLAGQLAAEPEIRTFPSGAEMARLLVTVRTERPRRRVDVVPVTWWEPPTDLGGLETSRGTRVWVVGSVQRRFWSSEGDKRSRVEIVAWDVRGAGKEEVPDSGEPSAAA